MQKLHYLKQSLHDGSAYPLVHDFLLTDTAYAEAYAFVNARYDNKRAVVQSLSRINKTRQENGRGLGKFVYLYKIVSII